MPKLSKHEKLKPGVNRSRKNSASANAAFQEENISYSSGSTSSPTTGLRALQQISYPELCSWPPDRCKAFLFEKKVLSDEVPTCWSCLKPMQKVDRQKNGDVQCKTTACYLHPKVTWPREAYTPLHSQARQYLD